MSATLPRVNVATSFPFMLTIDGRGESSSQLFEVINPATETVCALCPDASREQLDRAVAAARAAFPLWASTPVGRRRIYLHQLGQALLAHCDALAALLTREQGKPLRDALDEVRASAGLIDVLANIEVPSEVLVDGSPLRVEMHRRPLGVVGAITPWNSPVYLAAANAAAALVTGNTLVIKPSPKTPLSTLRFGELSLGVLPPGVLNVLSGADQLGAWMTEHPGIQKIAFTGSQDTGKKVMRGAADTLKRITLELGGNDAAIVLADADPKRIAADVFHGAFRNCGQICNSIKRLYVHDSIYEQMCVELAQLAERVVIGDGMNENTQMGPLQNVEQYTKVQSLLADCERIGARIVAGGVLPSRPGYFMPPTIVSEISDGARLVDEEQFGPILPVIRFSDIEDVLRRANGTPFGLGASVWTSNSARGAELAARMEAGTVWVNQHGPLGLDIPFGGIKQSGIGVQFSRLGLEEFTTIQIIRIETN